MFPAQHLSLNIPDTGKPRVVIIGGGFGGLSIIKNLRHKNFQVVLLDKHNYNTFQPLLYQVATAGLHPDAIAGSLRHELRKNDDFHFRMLEVLAIDSAINSVSTVAGSLTYDYLVIANGTKPNFFGNKQIKQYALPLKTIPDALHLRNQIMQRLEWLNIINNQFKKEQYLNIVIVGGGPTGVETAGALAELKTHVLPKDYPEIDFSFMKIFLVEGTSRLLGAMSATASNKTKADLEQMGVIVKLNTLVETYDAEVITFKGGEQIATATVIRSAGIAGNILPGIKTEWLQGSRILVDENCRVLGCANIFAIGDIALMKTPKYPQGHPCVAQPAMQMGAYLGKNLWRLHQNQYVKPFKYFDKGSLATIGRSKAVADFPGNIKVTGRIAWYIWLFIHITYLISFRNKLLVMANWIWSFFTYDKGNKLIIRPYNSDVLDKKLILEDSYLDS